MLPHLSAKSQRFSDVHVHYMLSPFRLSSVCLSVTLMHRTQQVEIFGNFTLPFGTLAISSPPRKILRRSSQGNPSVGGLNARGVAKYSDFSPLEWYISKTVQTGGKLVLITNRESYTCFRLVPKSVTLNDLERRNGPYFALFLPNLVISGAYCIKVVDKTITMDNLRLLCLQRDRATHTV